MSLLFQVTSNNIYLKKQTFFRIKKIDKKFSFPAIKLYTTQSQKPQLQ